MIDNKLIENKKYEILAIFKSDEGETIKSLRIEKILSEISNERFLAGMDFVKSSLFK